MPIRDGVCCDFCRNETLAFAYAPDGSTRGLKVHVCTHCGLVQSAPRIARTKDRHAAAVSGGADWGNVRYGKGFRTRNALDAIARHADMAAPLAALDVGSNRGSFARAFLDAAPAAMLTAVEPDERFADSCRDLPRTTLIGARIEDTALAGGGFDIVHSCHTIEHLAAPFAALKDHARVLKPGGLLVLDAPNIALIGGEDIAEEWFIDKHLFHFSARTLSRMIEAAGFSIIAWEDPSDPVNLLFIARKTGAAQDMVEPDAAEAAAAMELLLRYQATRTRNLASLRAAAAELTALAPRKIALWGAGRLFDLLVREGGFDPHQLSLLIDAHLKPHMEQRHGVALSGPEALDGQAADVVVVMSRMFAGEIADEIRRRAPRAEIILYADLLGRARASQSFRAA
ncbi:MAG TPA: class I SAM-dependent methyltransferase [Rhizomicrobium sp.]|nr:class I SAM-dependent methyltransferase [Rhizomicrobium sp.]